MKSKVFYKFQEEVLKLEQDAIDGLLKTAVETLGKATSHWIYEGGLQSTRRFVEINQFGVCFYQNLDNANGNVRTPMVNMDATTIASILLKIK